MNQDLQKAFQYIYETNGWNDPETKSGCGSTVSFTEGIRKILPPLLQEYNIKTMLDAGCGDWNWMGKMDLRPTRVLACDIVPNLIEENIEKYGSKADFFTADMTVDELPDVDLILCRAVLFHLSFENIQLALENMKRHSKYLLLTSHPFVAENREGVNGDFRRLNLRLKPISLGEPLHDFNDGPGIDGVLSLWKT